MLHTLPKNFPLCVSINIQPVITAVIPGKTLIMLLIFALDHNVEVKEFVWWRNIDI